MWVALETKQKATIFFSNRQSQSNGSLNIYICIHINYISNSSITPHPPPPGFSWLHTMAKQKWKTWKKKKKVDSISMIQLAICYGIQGDSFSHTLA